MKEVEFWSLPEESVLRLLETSGQGLSSEEAGRRLVSHGANLLHPKRRTSTLQLFFSQFKSPIILVLLFAAVLAYFVEAHTDAGIIFLIVLASGTLGFWQESKATDAVNKLLSIVQIKATVMRDGKFMEIPVEEIVPGDIAAFKAGDIVPGDCLIIECKDLYASEATLTGETYPAVKSANPVSSGAALSERTNVLYMGTHVESGTARAVVVLTGKETEFGKVSEHLKLGPPETAFEQGLRRFGYLLMEVTLILVLLIFAINVYFARPVLDSFLFALALAVGLTPQLLPAIVTVNLAHGARRMAKAKVIVKRLASIENFGSMNILCSDKTGTLSEGKVAVHAMADAEGNENPKVSTYAHLNASFQTGFSNPMDQAILAVGVCDISGYKRIGEVPYDFVRKRLSVFVEGSKGRVLITKGAVNPVFSVCDSAEKSDGTAVPLDNVRAQLLQRVQEWSRQGFRVLALAYRQIDGAENAGKEAEKGMTLLGLLIFSDPLKIGIADTIKNLLDLGVSLKIITGDSAPAARAAYEKIGLSSGEVLTGRQLSEMSSEALLGTIRGVDLFAEVEPNQKERIILSLRKLGNIVGFMGDGINDASGLHAADVGISVDTAADVAKEAADIVLLEKDLNVVVEGVREGRKTFANTLKYVFMATSANFGNMFSMAGASLFLSFLPLLPKQILLMNLLTDLPEMAIATDNVDSEMVRQPRRWDIGFIRRFMIVFGLLSSIFDYATFGVLLFFLHAGPGEFRTGWFIESVISASMIVLVIRTSRPFFMSKPGSYLTAATLLVGGVTILFPFTLPGKWMDFTGVPAVFVGVVLLLVLVYMVLGEISKKFFFRRESRRVGVG